MASTTPPARRSARALRLLGLAVALVVALLALVQLALPPLAERIVRDRLGGDDGEVTAVEVRAFPAVKLLWRHADRVSARVGRYDAGDVDIADELAQTRGIGELDVRIGRLDAPGAVRLRDVRVRGRDGALRATAVADTAAIAGALGARFDLALVPDPGGSVIVAGNLGGAPVRLRVVADGGRVIARPDGLAGLFMAFTVFSDPRIDVERIGAEPLAGGGYRFSARVRVT